MAIRIRVGNLILEVDSEADLRTALAALNATSNKTVNSSSSGGRSSGDPIADLFKRLPANQKKLLKTVAANQDGVTDVELRKALSMATNNALAGVTAGLTKNAKKAGLELSEIVIKEQRKNGSGERVYLYRVTPAARERLSKSPGRPRRAESAS